MPEWQGRSKGTALGYRLFLALLKRGGVFPAYLLLRFVALYYFFFSFRSSKVLFHFFHKKLGYGRLSSLARIYRNYYLFGQSLIDRVTVMSGLPNAFTYTFEGEEHLYAITKMKRGGLLLSAHIGNWEIAGHLLIRLQTRIHIVLYDGEDRQIKATLDSVTGKRNVNLIIIKNDGSHIYAINDAFKNNELVCMHADRFLEGNKTLKAGLLGEAAYFPMGPFVLAATFRVPVAFVFALKETSLHYHFFSSPPQEYPADDKKTMIQHMLVDFAREMENKIRRYPNQWYNYYDFWKP